MRVYQLANQLNITSKKVLEVAEILGINVKAHQSSLSEEDVSKIIKYLKKNRRIGIVFNKAVLTLIDFIKKAFKRRTFATGLLFGLTAFTIFGFSISNANDSVAEVEIIDTVEQIDVPTTTPTELIDQEISSTPLFTDSDDSTTTTTTVPVTTTTVPVTTTTTVPVTTTTTVPVTTTTVPVTTTTTVPVTTTTVPVTTTTTVPVTCDDESFQPYTLYTISGEANTVMSCRNEQDALESGYVLTINPNPPPLLQLQLFLCLLITLLNKIILHDTFMNQQLTLIQVTIYTQLELMFNPIRHSVRKHLQRLVRRTYLYIN